MDKLERYKELVARRKACRACPELTNPSDYMGGVFDSDHIGPWSLWHGDLDAKLVVVGQDWGDDAYFEKHEGHDLDKTPTNATLRELLESIEFKVNPASGVTQYHQGLFFTNAVLCLKKGGLGSVVKGSWIKNCGLFLKQTIDIINPAVVVSLGRHACISIIGLYRLKTGKLYDLKLSDIIKETNGLKLIDNTVYLPMYHPSPRVLSKVRIREHQLADWKRVKRVLNGD
jgi:uracil-DNA glycosylase family 4